MFGRVIAARSISSESSQLEVGLPFEAPCLMLCRTDPDTDESPVGRIEIIGVVNA